MSTKIFIFLGFLILIGITPAFSQTPSTVEEFNLKVSASPNIIYITGTGTYTAGTVVTLEQPPEIWKDYVFEGWQVDGRWTIQNPLKIVMNTHHNVEAIYSKNIGLGEIIIDSVPRIAPITVDGTIYLPTELPVTFNWIEGSDHTIIIEDVAKQTTNTRYKFDSWKDLNTDISRTVKIGPNTKEFVAIFKLQHYLKPVTEIGTAIGGGWIDEGTSATFELESNIIMDKQNDKIRYVFDSWDTGDYKNSASNIIDVSAPTTVNAKWNKEYKLDITTTVPEYDIFGTGWYAEGSQVALIAEEFLESDDADTQYVFEKWVSKGPNPLIIPNAQSATTSIEINKPYLIEAHYKNSYKVNVWTPYGSATGGAFYPAGQIAEIKMQQKEVELEPNRVKKIFSGWDAENARRMDFSESSSDLDDPSGSPNLFVIVDSPLNVTANWKTQYYLDVQSAEGRVEGAGWYDLGRLVPIAAKAPSAPIGMWSKLSFDRWVGDYEGDTPNARVVINGPKTVIAEWKDDNSPAIANSLILGLIGGVGIFIFSKTRNGKLASLTRKKPAVVKEEKVGFDKFFDTRGSSLSNPATPLIKSKKGFSNILDWLLGR